MRNVQLAPQALDPRSLLAALRTFASGDLSVRLPTNLRGLDQEIAAAFNEIVERNAALHCEFARVCEQVRRGQLDQRVSVADATGAWAGRIGAVNALIDDLVRPTVDIARVVEAVAHGDLSQRMMVQSEGAPRGEFLRLAEVVNRMVDQLRGFAAEVSRVAREVGTDGKLGGQAQARGARGVWRDVTDNVNQLAANLTGQVRAIAEVATAVTDGDLSRSITVEANGEIAQLKDKINTMIRNLQRTTLENVEQDWLKTNLARFTRLLPGSSDLAAVGKLVLSELATLVNVQQGVIYKETRRGGKPRLELLASYAVEANRLPAATVRMGEGLVGQCAVERKRILLESVPDDSIRIATALRSAKPLNILILPVPFEGEIKAVVELASLHKFSATHLTFLDQLAESLGVVFNTIEARMRTEALLDQSQSLTRELQRQQEELRKTNDRLERQAQSLHNSESLFKTQQEEMQRTNEQLEEKARLLSEQMAQVEYKNREVEQAKAALEEKAEQLASSSRYKSEFLANMSHELRTPLNSLLILAKLLVDSGKNLSPKQIEFAQTIYAAGTDLLSLINDILDLAKIESGTVILNIASERFCDLQDYVQRTFGQVATAKGLSFAVRIEDGLTESIRTDARALQQILKNLLSNAFKFTERGDVALSIYAAKAGWTPGHEQLDAAKTVVAFGVKDTGIGIPVASRKIIFEAFQQADGATSRKFGGTGLGLSISRELSRLLGGEITVDSVPDQGSTFTLFLPLVNPSEGAEVTAAPSMREASGTPMLATRSGRNVKASASTPVERPPRASAGRRSLSPGNRVAVIVEDDKADAAVLLDVAREFGFDGIVARNAATALRLIEEKLPDAITLDLQLPDMDGWLLLDLLKHNPATRHIPVSVISADERLRKCLQMGAMDVVRKPAAKDALRDAFRRVRELVDHDGRTVLVAARSQTQRASIAAMLGGVRDLEIAMVDSGERVLESLAAGGPDCIVLGETLADMSCVALIEQIVGGDAPPRMPIVVFEEERLGESDEMRLAKLADDVVVKRAPTLEAMLADVTLVLHRALADLPSDRRQLVGDLRRNFRELSGRKILIIDDDIRNIFALTGALEEYGLTVLNAETGMGGLDVLKNNPGIDAVLVDIMMPKVDGYDTIRMIRQIGAFRDIAIVAVTAKAMKGDREKCIQSGATDYIAKPVDVEQLLSLVRVLLTR